MKTLKSFFMLVILAVLIGGGYYYFRDTAAPEAHLTPQAGAIKEDAVLTLTLGDQTSGVARVEVKILQKDKAIPVLKKDYPLETFQVREELPMGNLLLEDGPLTVEITAVDRSIYHFGKGNTTTTTVSLIRDSRPPIISIHSVAHNLYQGGAGLIAYSVSEPVTRSGIQIGDTFFPGYEQPSGVYLCLFAFPYNVDTEEVPRLIAEDQAENVGMGGFYYHLNLKNFRSDKIGISDGFLDRKMPQFQHLFPDAATPLDVFLKVNRELRPKNRARLLDIGRNTATQFTWTKAFLRQPNAANRAKFGDRRAYIYNGKIIDNQTHLGIDLASIARADVPASNTGRVVFADFMGIYGQCIIIDHGLGLQSLYAHLSRMDVQVGDQVQRGQIIAKTGATGLAGGDHLHFGIVISGIPVNPAEWWDPKWVTNNITSKLDLAKR
ncbi:M23 family metallopeptidase [uncultured Desulfuromonas sp.]|uniref:M23 family metallopeptidase n=1 Tax=uncultured Desulfuromonas sp. TaxID=181013 RepID=UPI002AAABAF3|nr:M23 family metallopeptidase [uncultured Desulfuromonas sp.]